MHGVKFKKLHMFRLVICMSSFLFLDFTLIPYSKDAVTQVGFIPSPSQVMDNDTTINLPLYIKNKLETMESYYVAQSLE